MTTKYWPVNDHRWGVRDFVMWPSANIWTSVSTIGKQVKTRALTGKRWMCSFTIRAATWRERAGEGCKVTVISEADETKIQDVIAQAAAKYALVVVDLEGAASQAPAGLPRLSRPLATRP